MKMFRQIYRRSTFLDPHSYPSTANLNKMKIKINGKKDQQQYSTDKQRFKKTIMFREIGSFSNVLAANLTP